MKNAWRQLRWRILAAQMLVVFVGVVTLTVTATFLAEYTVSPALLDEFHRVGIWALLVAALAATVIGLVTSVLLMRAILHPLRQIASSSQRIAAGHYDERVSLPSSNELTEVAEHFNQMAAALQAVETQRVALIGNVAHELRTPLAGLEGYLEGLIDGVFPNDPETFNALRLEVRRLHRLVDDLQTLSRVEAGQVQLHLERFDLLPLVQRVAAQLTPQASAQQQNINVTAQQPALAVYADADRTAQIMVNLVGNAIRYTPEGGQITIMLSKSTGTVSIAVHDTGIGIPATALPYVFERFYRVDQSRSRSSGGSGIGLTIARHLAWAMGGELTAASAGSGQGSTFTLKLPAA